MRHKPFRSSCHAWRDGCVVRSANNLTFTGGVNMAHLLRNLWSQEEGQDIAEYATMLAVIGSISASLRKRLSLVAMQSAHTKPVKSTSSSREIFYSTLAFLDEFHGHVA